MPQVGGPALHPAPRPEHSPEPAQSDRRQEGGKHQGFLPHLPRQCLPRPRIGHNARRGARKQDIPKNREVVGRTVGGKRPLGPPFRKGGGRGIGTQVENDRAARRLGLEEREQ